MTLVRLEDGAVLPLPRPVSLKNGSIDVIRAYAPDAVLARRWPNTIKGTIAHILKAPPDSIAAPTRPARPAWIVFPRYEAGRRDAPVAAAAARAFMRVAENAFNYSLLGGAASTALADA
jgi:hypothetical protein